MTYLTLYGLLVACGLAGLAIGIMLGREMVVRRALDVALSYQDVRDYVAKPGLVLSGSLSTIFAIEGRAFHKLRAEVNRVHKHADALRETCAESESRRKDTEAHLNRVYFERNCAVIFAACIVNMLNRLGLDGFNAGHGVDGNGEWDDDWRHVVYIDLPDGRQVSWHMSPEMIKHLDLLPEYRGEWDGTFLSRGSEFLYDLAEETP